MTAAKIPVLVVEDDATNRKLLSILLAAEGCDVRTAESAEDALAVLADFTPRIVVLDLVLPGMTGLALATRLRADRRYDDVPFVAVTALNGPETARRVHAAGCDDYIRKPIDAESFGRTIRAYLGARR